MKKKQKEKEDIVGDSWWDEHIGKSPKGPKNGYKRTKNPFLISKKVEET